MLGQGKGGAAYGVRTDLCSRVSEARITGAAVVAAAD